MTEGDCRDKDAFAASKYEIEPERILTIKTVVIEDVFGLPDKLV